MDVKSASSRAQNHIISEPDKKALGSDGVKAAVGKLTQDLKNNASKDVLDKDKSDAFEKYKAAGGQASSLEAFGKELVAQPADPGEGDSKAALRQAFNLATRKETTKPSTGNEVGTSPDAAPQSAPKLPEE